MTSQPDKLFRDSLENLQKNPSSAAWSRIEAGLDSSSKKGMWYKVAASIALISVATFMLWPSDTTPSNELSHKSTIDQPVKGTQQQPKSTTNNTPVKNQSPVTTNKQQRVPKKNTSGAAGIQNHIAAIPEQEVTVIESLPIIVASETNTIEKSNEGIAQTEATVTIVYTADEVNSRFLKKNPLPEATSDITKSSTIQKLIDVAYNIKNSEGSLGDLRLKKDEILALNFRESKQKQN